MSSYFYVRKDSRNFSETELEAIGKIIKHDDSSEEVLMRSLGISKLLNEPFGRKSEI